MSKVTVRVAAKLSGKSRETINNATKDGSLSYTLNGKKHKVIDVSELERVYPLVKSMEEVESDATVKKSQPPSESDSQEWRSRYLEVKGRLGGSEEKIELIEKHHKQERSLFEDQVENLQQSLKLAQEGHNKATLLLEHQNNNEDNSLETAISQLKDQVANQEKTSHEKLEVMVKEKSDVEKANRVYKLTGIIFVCVAIAVTIYALIEQGIIQFN